MPADRRRGFTLLEVLVATAVFAIAALALLNAQSNQVVTDQRLEEKTMAHWVAQDRLADMRLQGAFPDVGQGDSTVTMAGRDWRIAMDVQGTPSPNVRRVTLAVGPASKEFGEKLPAVATLTGFLPQVLKNDAATPSAP